MKKVTVLGAGMVGSAIAADLSNQYNVIVADLDINRLSKIKETVAVQTIQADLSVEENINKIVSDSDLVIGAVPGFLGFKTLESVIKAGKDIVDISFFDENPFLLDKLAKEKNVTAVVDCGVAPGLSNIILGYLNTRMSISDFQCIVGGLPFKRTWPFQYKAPFSPIDVIEEYIRPARIVENGQIIVKAALSDPEFVEVDPVGTLVAFNTDGLRSLVDTMKIPFMKEKTLRYPGHIEIMELLRECGFFSKDEIEFNDAKIKPLDMTARLLFPKWKLEQGEEEFTALQVIIKGKTESKETQNTYKLFDRYDHKTHTTSMARTTGYTCSAVASLVMNGNFKRKGICPPEFIGAEEGCFEKVIAYLEERNIKLESSRN